ncbi:mechanosensitive ion channel family protein [Cyanobium sp. Maggiore-St4-Cus]|uniref:mechanosensitive ion channel family protein n=1 Tax=Cyanobium sp. Maggiore-St4-Cus TaxID=2823717 RepID=UPI0020CE62CA|nr:mechanosensitive ion channel family protein [Cyanobium sp. Maggiore-St4-Cus]MCP9788295.1 mechanosensitive ion channel family protein [Cyanobium sp. Maggiore-St4-Cus]
MPEMLDSGVLLQGLGLEVLLLAIRLLCVRAQLAPLPLRLPSVAILIWLVHANLPASIANEQNQLWLDSVLLLSRSYAGLQLMFWLFLELPSPISWWAHPPKILRDLSALAIGAALTLVVLQQAAKINVVGLVTTSAILTAVIGLAAQEALKDLFAGIMLRVDNPFVEGDYLELGDDVNGWVDSLTLLSTRLRHVHGAVITLPNSMMWQKNMRRFSPKGPIARELHIHLDRELPPNEATKLLLRVAERSHLVLKKPEPQAIVYAYHDYAITYELEVWQEDPTDIGYDDLRGELLSMIWYSLERIGQRVPFPVQEYKRRHGPAIPEEPQEFNLQQRLAILSKSPLFGNLSDEQLADISALTRCIRFAEGEQIVVENEEGDTLYQIVSGQVAVIKTMAEGDHQEVARLGAPAIFGEMSVFNEEPRSATVRALEQCVLLEVERNDLRPLLESHPAIVEQLAQSISERRAALLKLTPETKAKQGNDLLDTMLRLFVGS